MTAADAVKKKKPLALTLADGEAVNLGRIVSIVEGEDLVVIE